jgi:hypothetical protein
MFKFKKSQRFRVIIHSVHLFTTAWDIRMGVGDNTRQNAAIQDALIALELIKGGTGAADAAACGLGGCWQDYQVQLNVME